MSTNKNINRALFGGALLAAGVTHNGLAQEFFLTDDAVSYTAYVENWNYDYNVYGSPGECIEVYPTELPIDISQNSPSGHNVSAFVDRCEVSTYANAATNHRSYMELILQLEVTDDADVRFEWDFNGLSVAGEDYATIVVYSYETNSYLLDLDISTGDPLAGSQTFRFREGFRYFIEIEFGNAETLDLTSDVFANAQILGCGQKVDLCLWEQFPWDGEDAQSSESGTAIEESRTADEFCLKEGYVHRVDEIIVEMLTNSTEPDATLQLYEDCNGCPGELLDCGFFKNPRYEVIEVDAHGDLDLVRFYFNTGPREHEDEYGEVIFHPGLWLKGGCYWVSPVGLGDGTGYDRYLWCTAGGEDESNRGRPPQEGEELLGAIPKTQVGELKVGPEFWEEVDETNVGCRNFCFKVKGESCCILQDNGIPSDVTDGAVDTTGVDCFNADNFLIPPCSNIRELCFFSAYIWTNCDCERTKIRIVRDECLMINDSPVIFSRGPKCEDPRNSRVFRADKCVQITGFGPDEGGISFDGQDLALYRVEFHNIRFEVEPGDNHWIELEVQGTGAFNERGFWAFNTDCLDPLCTVNISEGQAICPRDGIIDWTEVGSDYTFCIAGRDFGRLQMADDDNASACVADMDGNGNADVADLITFLGFWFEGCEE